MKTHKEILRMVTLSMTIAIGVLISPILRVEGLCPTAHLVNIVVSVLLGPWYSLLNGVLTGIIRMSLMGIPPLALTGQIFGAFFSGVLYRASKGKISAAVAGEIIGTGLIGSILSYPIMSLLWGKSDLTWFFYVPSFVTATIMGGSLAFILLKKLQRSGELIKLQEKLDVNCCDRHD